jgi:hypothetical protein
MFFLNDLWPQNLILRGVYKQASVCKMYYIEEKIICV